MTEREKMLSGRLYHPGDPELALARDRAKDLTWRYNQMNPTDWEGRTALLRELLGRQRTDSAWKAVEGAKNYIAEHYDDPNLSVEALCDQLHLSPAYFSTLFKRETQKSFTAYVTEVRMERAARLLRETDEKTYLIAQRTGYADPNYFSFVFKRHFGMPPSKFRAEGQD